jgi:hypothetical protein
MSTSSWQVVERKAKRLFILLFTFLFFACAQTQDLPPSGTIVPWEKLGELSERSHSQIESRKDELELQIKLSGPSFSKGETIEVTAVLKNTTNKELIVRKMDTMPIMGSEFISTTGIKFILISQNTQTELESSNAFWGFVDEGPPPPEFFSALPAHRTRATDFVLSNIYKDLPIGAYSLQLEYTNDSYGARSDSGSSFIDYDAWIGTILSDVEIFQISP